MGVAFWLFLFWANGGPNATPLLGVIGILFVFTFSILGFIAIALGVVLLLAVKPVLRLMKGVR